MKSAVTYKSKELIVPMTERESYPFVMAKAMQMVREIADVCHWFEKRGRNYTWEKASDLYLRVDELLEIINNDIPPAENITEGQDAPK